MSDLQEHLMSIKRKLDNLEQKKSKIVWEIERIEKELLDEYGIKDPKEARKEAEKSRAKAEALRKESEDRLSDIETKYKDLLEMAG
jgi:hypothetical protein